MKKPPALRDLRGAAEIAARDYTDRHRCHDRFIETRLMASSDQASWKIVALVDDPDRTQEVSLPFFSVTVPIPLFPAEWKDHTVVVRKRKP